MRRLVVSCAILVLAAWTGSETIAGKGGNGKGNGGGDPTPAGRVYFLHDSGPSTQLQSMLADGSDVTDESVPGSVDAHLGYARHGGAYWALDTKLTTPGANPDNSEQNVLVAVRDGNEVELTSVAAGGERITSVRWAQDDSFVSFVSIRWTGPAADDAAAHVYTAAVAWTSGVPALTETPVQEFEVPSGLDGVMVADVWAFDWSPDGTEIAYGLDGEIWVRELGAAAPSAALRAGTQPAWSPDGLSIALVDGGLWTMDPDGSNSTELVADSSKEQVYGRIAWSPGSADLAFVLGKRRRGSIPSGLATVNFDIARVSATGSGKVRITNDSGSDDRDPAWRDD